MKGAETSDKVHRDELTAGPQPIPCGMLELRPPCRDAPHLGQGVASMPTSVVMALLGKECTFWVRQLPLVDGNS